MKIKIYTDPNCPYSNKAKKFFQRRKLVFEEVSLAKKEGARQQLFELTGQLATPVIQIDDELIIGFEESLLKEILKKKKQVKKRVN